MGGLFCRTSPWGPRCFVIIMMVMKAGWRFGLDADADV